MEEEIDVEKFLAKPPKKTVLSKRRYQQVKSLLKSEFGEEKTKNVRIKPCEDLNALIKEHGSNRVIGMI